MKQDILFTIFINLFENKNSEIYKLLYEKNILFKESIKENNTNNTLYINEEDWLNDSNYIRQEIVKQINLIKTLVERNRYSESKLDLNNVRFFIETEFPNIKIDKKIITLYVDNTSAEINFYIVEKIEFSKYISELSAFITKLAKLPNLEITNSFKVKSNILSSSQVNSLQLDLEDFILDINRSDLRRTDPGYKKETFIRQIIFAKNYFYYYLVNNFENSKTNGLFSVVIKKIDDILNIYKNLSKYDIDIESISDLTGDEVLNKAISRSGGLLEFLIKNGTESLFRHYLAHCSSPAYLYSNRDVDFEKFSIFFRDIENNKDSTLNLDELFATIEDAFKRNIEKINTINPSIPELNIPLREEAAKKQNSIDEDIERLGNNITLGGSKTIRDIKIYHNILEMNNHSSYIYNMSYKYNINIITKKITNLEEKIEYILKLQAPEGYYYDYHDMIPRFIETFKKIVIKELQESESFIQGKSDSINLFDKIKYENTPINNLNVNIKENPYNRDYYKLDLTYNGEEIKSDLNDIMKNLHTYKVYTDNIEKIGLYLNIFKDELHKALKTNNLNQLRDHIINIINFIFNKDNNSKFKSIEKYADERGFYGGDILKNIDSDTNKRTKNEKLKLYYQALNLIHNNSNNHLVFKHFIANSEYLTKLNSTAVLEIFECIGSIFNIYNFNESINNIIKKKPELIKKDIYTNVIKNIINIILRTKTENIFKDKADNYIELDGVISNILKNDPSSNIRKLKYITSLVANYEAISNWIDLAEEKEEDVFAPSFSTESFRFRVLEDFDPYHFKVGMDTNCCQTIGGDGENAAIDSFINPKAGVVVLEVNDGGSWNLAAQSYFHVFTMNNAGKEIKGIILDNIEAGVMDSKYGKDDFYPKAYAILGRYLKNKGFDIVGCGKAFTEVIRYKFEDTSIAFDPRHFEIEENALEKYTDFNHESFYDLLRPMFNFEMPSNIDSEVKMAKYNDILLKLSKFLSNTSLERESIKVYNLI